MEDDLDYFDYLFGDRDFHYPLNLVDEFEQAIKHNRHDVVDAILGCGFVPSEKSLIAACFIGSLDMVVKLLACGHKMDVNEALLIAVDFNHESLLKHLFVAGANINYCDQLEETALHHVHNLNICQWLLDMGAVQKGNVYGNFPIHQASKKQNPEIVKLLLNHGAEQTPNDYLVTPLHNACEANDLKTVRVLLEHGGQQTMNYLETPLHIACKYRNLEMVQLLLQHGGIQVPNVFGATPLVLAHNMDSEEVIRLL